MKTIYLDSDYKCHVTNDGTMRAVEVDLFDGKCDTFIEGYRYVPYGESWVRKDGEVFNGAMVACWKSFDELDIAQRGYEKQQLKEYKQSITEYEKNLAELDALILDYQYNNLVEGL